MIVVPIGHDQGTVARWPWVTVVVIVACLVAHVLLLGVNAELDREHPFAFREAIDYLFEHPYLEADEVLLFPRGEPSRTERARIEAALAAQREVHPTPDSQIELSQQQATLDELTDSWLSWREQHPLRRWGHIPAQQTLLGLFTHLFVHAGLIHLLGNLFILYLVGPPIEDLWGRLPYAALYLAAGLVAALSFGARYPDLDMPLVGASGAIAGIMGAFFVRYWDAKIDFFYFIWIIRIFTGLFSAPAWIILAFWLLNNVMSTYAADELFPGGGSGVAYWAHVTGFLFGAAVAGSIKAFDLERKYLRPRVEASMDQLSNPVLEQVHAARAEGKLQQARALLEKALQANPGDRDAALELWDIAREQGRAELEAPRFLRTIRDELRAGERELAIGHWQEVEEVAPNIEVEPGLALQLAEAELSSNAGSGSAARRMLERLLARAQSLPAGLLVRAARVAQRVDGHLAAQLAAAGLAQPNVPEVVQAELRKLAGSRSA